jgi:hypothetical protein
MGEAVARVLGERESAVAAPIIGVGLSMAEWARSCTSEDPVAVSASGPMWALQCEFPTVLWALMALPLDDALVIPERSWRATATDLYEWDRELGVVHTEPRWLVVQGDEDSRTLGATARQILTRYQRLVPRTNAASAGALFRGVLGGHRVLHDLSLPLVRADYDHALDTWQWVLRLSPFAGLTVQLAALFHDVERLVTKAERRIEHPVPGAPGSSDACAEVGAKLAAQVLEGCDIDAGTVANVACLVREHELRRSASGGDAGLLADADALSFFSLSSPGFADHHGQEQLQKKVSYTLARMSSRAVRRLADVRLREDVRCHLVEAARAEVKSTVRQLLV